MSAVKITQVRSANGTNPNQKATLRRWAGPDRQGGRAQGLAAAAGPAAGRLAPGRGRRWLSLEWPRRPRSEEIGLHNLKPKPGSRRPRKRIGRGEGSGLGKTSGRGHKGAGSRAGAKRKAGYEGGQNPIHMRMRKLRGPHKKKSMPFENFRTKTQPVNLSDLEERFDAGAEVTPATLQGEGPGQAHGPGQDPRPRRDLEEARRPRARLQRRRQGEDRGGRRFLPHSGAANAQDDCQRLQRRRHPQEARLHGGDAGALPARRLHPGAGRRRPAPSRKSRATSAARNILGFLNLFSGGSLSRL